MVVCIDGSTRLLIRLVLLINILSVTKALVAIPERRPAVTFAPRRQENGVQRRLFLENSPLLGGPAWLPLHVKVILEEADVAHRWDFVPLNATDTTVLRRLLTLESVPAEIRYQRGPLNVKRRTDTIPRFSGAGYDIVLEGNDDARTMAGLVAHEYDTEPAAVDSTEVATLSMIQKAEVYCATYRTDLHLIHNNCWTFAVQLYNHLRSDVA